MAQTYCTETIVRELEGLGVPFASFLARALVALLTGRKASVQRLANLLPGAKSQEAARQQVRRFLDQPALTQERWAGVLARLLPTRGPWVLALDRTEWWVGHRPVNLLVLAVVCGGCAVPLLWLPLDKPGASDTEERIALLSRFVRLFGAQKVRFVTADREFIGRDWVAWLLKERVPFRIRIKAGEWLTAPDYRGDWEKQASEWFRSRACACRHRRMLLWGLPVFVGGKRLRCSTDGRDGSREFLVVISDEPGDLLEDYRLRWKIETLFQAFKGRGFDMEGCRLTDTLRWSAFVGFLSLALAWCLRVGEFLDRVDPLDLKRHGRPAASSGGGWTSCRRCWRRSRAGHGLMTSRWRCAS